jgi:IS5 family transposase
MYKFSDNQLKFSDFGQPVGMKMNPENRWVKKAELIPWDEIEKRYAELFTNKKGNVAKALRMALGALIIQTEYGYSDEETALQIQEAGYLQFFCGYKEYDDSKPPFDASTMVYFRKRLTPEILGEINELIIKKASDPEKKSEAEAISEEKKDADGQDDSDDDHHDPEPPSNSGTLIVDATCAPSNIEYPQDLSLLNEGREKLEKIVDELYDSKDGVKPRTYRKQAHKDYLKTARKRRKGVKEIRKAVGKQLRYMKRDLGHIDKLLTQGKSLAPNKETQLEVLKTLYEQQQTMYQNKTHKIPDRIVSIAQPWLRPIVRGKVKAPVEFGAKLDISVSDGFVRLERQSFDAYNESENLPEIIERYKTRAGCYPECVLADKIYRNRNNLTYCKERGIRLSGPALGRPPKDAVINKKQAYKDNCDRVEVERAFSLAKGKYGLGLIRARLKETTQSAMPP